MRINVPLTPELERYVDEVGYREHEVLTQCRKEAASRGELAVMQVAPEQGALLALLIKLLDARLVLELGTFTGYSALAMALALPPSGRVITCDVDPELVEIASGFWIGAGVEDRVISRLGDAGATMRSLLAEGYDAKFDLILIDANKDGYPIYVEMAAQLLRPGGLLLVDDTLARGRVVCGPLPTDPPFVGPAVEGVRAANRAIARYPLFSFALIPAWDGLTIAMKAREEGPSPSRHAR